MAAVLKRFELTLTNGHPNSAVHTFTWAVDYAAAYARVVDQIDDPIWEGYSFELAKTPTEIKR